MVILEETRGWLIKTHICGFKYIMRKDNCIAHKLTGWTMSNGEEVCELMNRPWVLFVLDVDVVN